MTDADFLLRCLQERPHTLGELLARSFQERGHGLTVHSRAAQLRARGFDIQVERVPGRERGAGFLYRLGAVPEADSSLAAAGGPPGSDHADVSHPSAPTQPTLFTEPRKPVWA